MNHNDFMAEAVRLSRQGMQSNAGGPFGAIIVLDDKIIARGWNEVVSTNDPTAHAEVNAIRRACATLGSFRLDDCDIYTSCEPCPMCLAAIYWSRVRRIFYANTRHDAAAIGFDDATFYEQLPRALEDRTVPMTQLLRDEALQVFGEWRGKPDKMLY
ncbi:MAG TPA: nucleoside deaminase [Verrucomicrobiae bacterium]|jgi:tRNA(Arg) A34 adenosine deaminase TadA|nr:nucleoside deaminase [Verrucomicrobiae bacterium]